MAADKAILILALTLVSACKRDDAVSLREMEVHSPQVVAASETMYRDYPSKLGLRKYLAKVYYIDAKTSDCIWFVYDPKVGFHDSEFVYCTRKNENHFTRL